MPKMWLHDLKRQHLQEHFQASLSSKTTTSKNVALQP